MADFKKAKERVLKLEGGYQAHPDDNGNYNSRGELVGTKYGIAAKTYEAVTGVIPTVQVMKNLSLIKAESIYKKLFWDKVGGDHLKNQAVAEIVFDHAINAGPWRAIKMAQAVLNQFFKTKLLLDGAIGPKTIAAINDASSATFHDKYKWMREKYYRYAGGILSLSDPIIPFLKTLKLDYGGREQSFVDGWLARLETFADLAKKKSGNDSSHCKCPNCGVVLAVSLSN